MNIGKAITHYRKTNFKNMTQRKVSHLLGTTSTGYVCILEAKKTNFNLETLLAVCKILNIDIIDLLTKAKEYP